VTELGDFTATRRVIPIAGVAIAIGVLAAFVEVMRTESVGPAEHVAFASETLRTVTLRMAHLGITTLRVVDDESTPIGSIVLEDVLVARRRHLEEEPGAKRFARYRAGFRCRRGCRSSARASAHNSRYGRGVSEQIAQWCADGKAAWPDVVLTPDELAATCTTRDLASVVDGKELYLAAACARGNAAALKRFDELYAPSVKQALRRLDLSPDDHADVMQLVRVRLMVGQDGGTPRIVEYAGTGRLGALVFVAATRIGLNLLRARQRIDDSDLTALDPADPDGLDLADQLGKQMYRAELRTAFEEAVKQLERKERTLLRLSVIDGLSIDELGTMYRVHRATVARWIAAARDRLTELARDRFLALTGLSTNDLASVGELVQSQIQVSMERLLRTTQIND